MKIKQKKKRRHACKWCGAVRNEDRLVFLKKKKLGFWRCQNQEMCAENAAKYIDFKD